MYFEINRTDLLKLKTTNNALYQFILSLEGKNGDYCETLDKAKLAKECELGYFKIDELFTRSQIVEAYSNAVLKPHLVKDTRLESIEKMVYSLDEEQAAIKPKPKWPNVFGTISTKPIPKNKNDIKQYSKLRDFLAKPLTETLVIKTTDLNNIAIIKLLLDMDFTLRSKSSYTIADFKSSKEVICLNYLEGEEKIFSYDLGHKTTYKEYVIETDSFIDHV